jgi:20S proteasome alpha/beta subunit
VNRLEKRLPWCQKLDWQSIINPDEPIFPNQPFPKPKIPSNKLREKFTKPMSQIIGIICNDCILVACESQGTLNERKQFDANKMQLVRFKDKWALVALADGIAAANRVIYLMQTIAKDQPLESEWTLANVASQAMNQFKNEIMAMHQNADYSLQERAKLFGTYHFSLMLADYSRSVPCLYTMDFLDGISERHSLFAVMGAADAVVQFAISQLPEKKVDWELAIVTIVDALEQIKGINIYCGGAIKVAIVEKRSIKPIIWPDSLMDRIVELTRELRKKHRGQWQNDAHTLIEQIRREQGAYIEAELQRDREATEKELAQELEAKRSSDAAKTSFEELQKSHEKSPDHNNG